MALVFGTYALPAAPSAAAAGAVLVLTAVVLRGIVKTVRLTKVLLGVVLVALAVVVAAALTGGTVDASGLTSTEDVTAGGVLEGAGLLFFAFAGYARIATLGDEVRDPARTLPRAVRWPSRSPSPCTPWWPWPPCWPWARTCSPRPPRR